MCSQMKTHRVRSGGRGVDLSTSVSVPVELRCISLLLLGCMQKLGSSLKPVILEFLWRFPLIGNDQLLISFPTPLSSLGSRAEKFQASNYGQSFLLTSFHTGAHPKSPLVRTEDAPSALTAQESISVLGALCQEPGEETNIHIFFSYITLCTTDEVIITKLTITPVYLFTFII